MLKMSWEKNKDSWVVKVHVFRNEWRQKDDDINYYTMMEAAGKTDCVDGKWVRVCQDVRDDASGFKFKVQERYKGRVRLG